MKSYLAMGGAMHDCAVAAWGVKGWYDYLRPISALRYMADLGQSSDNLLPSYDPNGVRLYPGYIELVTAATTAVGQHHEHLAGEEGKIALYAWRGPDYIADPLVDEAGVGWILAENWWPYQRPSFVTPPFAGYVSGHSTYSRAAAIVMEELTGDAFFPGGMGTFVCPQNSFLVFEEGPSQTITLQWATYKDASDQTSLSRIWGGIHPPADDIPGRVIGEAIGPAAFDLAMQYYGGPYNAWEDLGDSLDGTFPAPTLYGEGSMQGGTAIKLIIEDALPFAPGFLVMGFTEANTPFKGGIMVPSMDIIILMHTFLGDVELSGTWPTGFPPSASIYFQYWVSDAGGPVLFSASNGLKATTPP